MKWRSHNVNTPFSTCSRYLIKNSIVFQRGIECLEILYIPIIVANCFTGYVEENTSAQIILDLKKIMWRYFKSYFIIDVLSITGLFNAHQSSETVSSKTISWAIIFDSAKILRLPTLHKYINNLLIVKEVGVS